MSSDTPRAPTGLDPLATLNFLMWGLLALALLMIGSTLVLRLAFGSDPTILTLMMGGVGCMLGCTIVMTVRRALGEQRDRLAILEQERADRHGAARP